MTTLRIVIRGSPGSIQLDALAGVSESAFRLLDDIDASLDRKSVV